MKKLLVIISFFGSVVVAKSQNLTVEGTAPNLYITHTVAPKENFYSVGRLYNQNAKAIASFNNLVMEKGLAIGQHIKIPLNAQNLDMGGGPASGETLIPLTHLVAKAETISKIASDNNVSAQAIKQWNSLSSDNIAPGTPLVVGHLKMSSGTTATTVAKTTTTAPEVNQPANQEIAAAPKQVAQPKKEETVTAVAETPAPQKKETAPAVTQEPVKQPETVAAVTKDAPAKAEDTRKSQTYSYSSANNMGSIEGVFANVYTTDAAQKAVSTKSGEAATFKSTSGWQDKKYYVLMNDVTPGTILKITSTENKIVYAKVLGSMPDMKENNGLLLRISNAAASYLGIIDPKFPVQISYYQ